MSQDEGLFSGPIGIVLTDIFLAATAAILLLLAVLQDNPDIPLPVQADFVLQCGRDGEFRLSVAGDETPMVVLPDASEIGAAVVAMATAPRLFQTLALIQGEDGLPAACLQSATSAVRRWNTALGEGLDGAGGGVVLGIVAVPAGVEGFP